ncbi:BA14K family protein [Bartonella sp. OT172YNZD]|uniref:BA14K family protein n=1 Tax=Bartonella sp. OT172YNZD TaxID=3243572 RepID=UPI0035CFA73E
MKKVIKLAVLSAMSAVTVFIPLDTTLADMAWDHSNYVKRKIDDTIREMKRRVDFPFYNFSSHSSHSKYHSFDDPHKRHYVGHRRTEHHHVERKTYHYVEHEKTKHSHIHINNGGDALAAGILGLAAGAILGKVFKQPEQPQFVYQIAPPNQVVYQKVPQNQRVYQLQQTVEYEPVQQSWESDWLNYCKKKYRSFNPKTGTFRGSDGLNHICYAPVN